MASPKIKIAEISETRLCLDGAPSLVIVTIDKDGTEVYASACAERLLGIEVGETPVGSSATAPRTSCAREPDGDAHSAWVSAQTVDIGTGSVGSSPHRLHSFLTEFRMRAMSALVDIEATGEALGLLFAETLVQLAAGDVPAPLVGVVRHLGKEKFDLQVIVEGDMENALRASAKPTVREAAWLLVIDDDDEQTISMHLCTIPVADPPFSVVVEVSFDDDADTLYVSKPTMRVSVGADDTVPDQLWPAINRGMSRHEGLQRAPIVLGNRHFET